MNILWTLEFWSYPSKHWNFGSFINITILISFFKTLEFLVVVFNTFAFWSYSPKRGIVPYLYRLEFWLYPSNYWTSDAIFKNIGILILSFESSEFWCCFYKFWNSQLARFPSWDPLHHWILSVAFKCFATIRLLSFVSCPDRSYTFVFCFQTVGS